MDVVSEEDNAWKTKLDLFLNRDVEREIEREREAPWTILSFSLCPQLGLDLREKCPFIAQLGNYKALFVSVSARKPMLSYYFLSFLYSYFNYHNHIS